MTCRLALTSSGCFFNSAMASAVGSITNLMCRRLASCFTWKRADSPGDQGLPHPRALGRTANDAAESQMRCARIDGLSPAGCWPVALTVIGCAQVGPTLGDPARNPHLHTFAGSKLCQGKIRFSLGAAFGRWRCATREASRYGNSPCQRGSLEANLRSRGSFTRLPTCVPP